MIVIIYYRFKAVEREQQATFCRFKDVSLLNGLYRHQTSVLWSSSQEFFIRFGIQAYNHKQRVLYLIGVIALQNLS